MSTAIEFKDLKPLLVAVVVELEDLSLPPRTPVASVSKSLQEALSILLFDSHFFLNESLAVGGLCAARNEAKAHNSDK